MKTLIFAGGLALLIPTSAFAGRLDLDLYGPEVRFTGGAAAPEPTSTTAALWEPGDPRDLQAAPKSVQVVAETGYTAMGAAGAAEALHGSGSGRAAKAESAGFAAIALINFWRLLKTLWD
jgi:hypothetical protein